MASAEVLALIEQAKREERTTLDLSRKNLTDIPIEIAQLSNLTSLDLGGNQIEEIPEAIDTCDAQQILNYVQQFKVDDVQ